MIRLRVAGLASACWLAAGLAQAAVGCDVVGEYGLQGMHETASGLSLAADGSFAWVVIHGLMDQLAQGRWTCDAGRVVLENDWSETGPAFHRYLAATGPVSDVVLETATGIADAHPGHGVIVVVEPMMGGARDLEFAVRLDGGVEQLLEQARARPMHALFVADPARPVEAVGLRDPDTTEPMQWFPVAAGETTLAFALRTGMPPVFREFRLRIDGDELVPEWPEAGEQGRYVRDGQ